MKAARPKVRRSDACGHEPDCDALDSLGPGEQLCLMLEQEPFTLYRILSDRAYAYCSSALPGGMVEVTIWRCGAQAA